MSVCETEHWVLDCGEGSGCMMFEGEDGQVFYWKCFPQVVKASAVFARKKSTDGKPPVTDLSQRVTICYNDLDNSQVAEAVSELTGRAPRITKTGDTTKRTMCQTGTLNDLLRENGLEF